MYLSTADRLPEKPDVEAIKKFKQKFEARAEATAGQQIAFGQSSYRKWIWLVAILIIPATTVFAGLLIRKRGN